ncbi:MAG TPA: chemotaxis response regulator protein-glutamate methylesterase [Bacillota bacterium]|nr:chemotaxis response regulator protein-glutamate methylesterase [Bacillota bacterium]
MEKVQVLVIDDSAFMRKVISQLLSEDPRIQVIATARNGEDGLKKIEQFQPDVVTLDVEMPVMGGITTLKYIMNKTPTPVVMVSSMTAKGAELTVKAIQLGAIDFIQKPSGPISLDMDHIQENMIETVIAASKANVKEKKVKKIKVLKNKTEHRFNQSLFAIGTSTGGPRALQAVLTALPADFHAPIVIVQHMPAQFTKSLADRLHALSSIQVKEAEHGELLQNGVAYIAPGGEHMHIRQVGTALAIELNKEPPVLGHRPSVNVMLESIASLKRLNKIIIILTGMGRDGTAGIQQIKQEDPSAFIIAESKETTVVDGMPRSALQANVVNEVVPLQSVWKVMVGSLDRIGR